MIKSRTRCTYRWKSRFSLGRDYRFHGALTTMHWLLAKLGRQRRRYEPGSAPDDRDCVGDGIFAKGAARASDEMTSSSVSITVAIPTYGRDQVLVDTIRHVLALVPPPAEVIVLDQTKDHASDVVRTLKTWHLSAAIRWLHLPEPLIPRAMNRGLIEARSEIVLFLDDDIRPGPGLLQAHANGHRQTKARLVAGRVIQPSQEGMDFSRDNEFHFACCRPTWIEEFMAGNFSIRRDDALKIGGFD